MTDMADRMPSELQARGWKFQQNSTVYTATVDNIHISNLADLPDAIDWRDHDVVTPVKNQGQCGSCWAFSTASAVESAYALAGNPMQEFSPQQINSCVDASEGCAGGDTVAAMQYLVGSPGLASSWYWPYLQGLIPSQKCLTKACTKKCDGASGEDHDLSQLEPEKKYIGPYAKVTGFKYAVPACQGACDKQNLTALAAALVEAGPLSVIVNAASWSSYTGGVLTAKACGGFDTGSLDHAVQLVGYNKTAPTPYWIVRNSWDTTFGIDGYIHLEMAENTCGIAVVFERSSSPPDVCDASALVGL